MRENKLRAWDKVAQRYTDNPLVLSLEGNEIYDVGWGDLNKMNIDNYILEQYTSLKDKNGVEIYEGDILNNDAVVEWFDDLNWDSGGSKHPGFYCRAWFEYKDDGAMSYHYGFDKNIEVIGNIHENPELLK